MNCNEIRIAVCSPSFSKDSNLRKKLLSYFPKSKFYTKDILLENNALIEFLSNQDGVIVSREKIDSSIIKNLPNLKIISKYGVGLDNIDQDVLKEANIPLGWTQGVNAYYVAELTLCFILGLLRNIFLTQNLIKDGNWVKDGGVSLSNKIIGIIGCGNVGKEVVKLLVPFKCRIIVNDIVNYEKFYEQYNITPVSFEEVLKKSKVISLHVPLDKSTYHMINREAFKLIESNSYLINTSRGAVVNTADLKWALKANEIAGVASDVFETEPLNDTELIKFKNFIPTPHIGGNAKEAVTAMGLAAIGHLVNFFK